MPDSNAHQPGLLLIISGPSGVGKTTIAHQIERELAGAFSVSMTTRPKTDNDTQGIDYDFVTRDQFEQTRDQGNLLEWAQVFGQYYGTPRQPVMDALAQGKLMIVEIDVQGAVQVKSKCPNAFAIFIDPPSEAELLKRLRRRKREDEQAIQRRFANAKNEITRSRSSGAYDAFIVNDDLTTAIEQAIALVRRQWAQSQGHAP